MACVRYGSWCGGVQFMWIQVVHHSGLGSAFVCLAFLAFLAMARSSNNGSISGAVPCSISSSQHLWNQVVHFFWLGLACASAWCSNNNSSSVAVHFSICGIKWDTSLAGPCLSLSFLPCLALVQQQQQQRRSGFQCMWNQVVHFSVFPRS